MVIGLRPNTFISGDTIRFETVFEVNGTLTDPDIIRLKIKNPNQVITTTIYDANVEAPGTIIKSGVGTYYLDLKVDLPGIWWARWEGSTPAPGVIEEGFRVVASNIVG